MHTTTRLNRLWFGSDWGGGGESTPPPPRVSIAFGSALIGVAEAPAYRSLAYGLNRLWFGSDWGATEAVTSTAVCASQSPLVRL